MRGGIRAEKPPNDHPYRIVLSMPTTITDIERLEAVATKLERLVDVGLRHQLTATAIEDVADAAVPVLLPEDHAEFHNACAALLWESNNEAWLTLARYAKRFRRRAAAARRRVAC